MRPKQKAAVSGSAGSGIRRFWPGGLPSVSGGRLARQGFSYEAFSGWEIAQAQPPISSSTIQDLVRSETVIRQLNAEGPTSATLRALTDQLLRAEAVASSRIEGLDLTSKALAEAVFDPKLGSAKAPGVLGNLRATDEALRSASEARRMGIDTILQIHAALFRGTQLERIAGRLRTSQNWVGGGDNPHKAVFIPVPEDSVRPLLVDLIKFIQRDDLPVLVQAAIAHAQFETIHPFEDGNGRVGRSLIYSIFRRRGLAPHYVPPISLVLVANYDAYIAGLVSYRERREDEWIGVFSRAAGVAAEGARTLVTDIEKLKEHWRSLATPRGGSAAANLIDLLPQHPVIDLKSATELLGTSDEAARLGIERLAGAGVLKEVTKRKWNRAWEAIGLFALLDDLESNLGTSLQTGGKPGVLSRTKSKAPRRRSTRNADA